MKIYTIKGLLRERAKLINQLEGRKISEDFFESLRPKCPRCGTLISTDEMGCEICPKCYKELATPDWDRYWLEVIRPVMDMDNIHILLVKDWKERIQSKFRIKGEKKQ